jgi:hypothetical protein
VQTLKLNTFNQLNNLRLQNLPALTRLDLEGNTSSLFTYNEDDPENNYGLDLSEGLSALEVINLKGAGIGAASEKEYCAVKLPCAATNASGEVLYASKLHTLNLNGSSINAITTLMGGNFAKDIFNFENVPQLTSFTMQNCYTATTIKNLNYRGNCGSIFATSYGTNSDKSCIEQFENCKIDTEVGCIGSMFYNCRKLKSLDGLDITIHNAKSLGLSTATTVSQVFYGCNKLSLGDIKKISQQLVRAGATAITSFMENACSESADTNKFILNHDFFDKEAFTPEQDKQLEEIDFTKLQNLSGCFRDTPFKIVVPRFFEKMTSLTNISLLFYSANDLRYLPQNSFESNTRLTTVTSAFMGCNRLGLDDDSSVSAQVKPYDSFCMMAPNEDWLESVDSEKLRSYTSKVFADGCAISDIENLFHGCTNIHPTDGLAGFFDSFKQTNSVLSNTKFAFKDCTRLLSQSLPVLEGEPLPNKLAENIFAISSLKNIDATFMNSSTTCSWILPNSLFGDKDVGVESASGLFAGCTTLTGAVPHGFFDPLAKTLTTIGANRITQTTTGTNVTAPGIFANTNITSIPKDLLRNLSKLVSCAGLISKYSSTSNEVEISTAQNTTFEGFTDYVDDTLTDPDAAVPLTFFSCTGGSALRDISYAFAGCTKITALEGADPDYYSFVKDETELNTLKERILQQVTTFVPSGVNTAAGLFKNCIGLKYIHSAIFKNKGQLKDLSYCFADCDLTSFDFNCSPFEGCISLANCKALFLDNLSMEAADTDVDIGVIPASLFNDCRSTLTDCSYMFANCHGLTGALGTGEVWLNRIDQLETNYITAKKNSVASIITKCNTSFDAVLALSRELSVDYHSLNEEEREAILAELNDDLVSRVKTEIAEELDTKIKEVFETELKLTAGSSDNLRSQYADIFAEISKLINVSITIRGTDSSSLKAILNGIEITVPVIKIYDDQVTTWDDLFNKSTTKSRIKYLTNPANKVVEIKQAGLLGDCTALTTVEGMFYNCKGLVGVIPADLFTGSNNSKALPITTMRHLFAGCSFLNARTTTSSAVLTSNLWLPVKQGENGTSLVRCKPLREAHLSERFPHILPSINEAGEFEFNDDSSLQTYIIYKTTDSMEDLYLADNEGTSLNYFLPKDWLKQVSNTSLTDIGHMFRHIGTLQANNIAGYSDLHNYLQSLSHDGYPYTGYPLKLSLHDELFANKSAIKKADAAFFANIVIGRSAISSTFLKSSNGCLEDISYIFGHSSLPGIVGTSGCFLAGGCKWLANTAYAFFRAANHQVGKSLYIVDGESGAANKKIPKLDQITDTGLFKDEAYKYYGLVDFRANKFSTLLSQDVSKKEGTFHPSANVVGIYSTTAYNAFRHNNVDEWSNFNSYGESANVTRLLDTVSSNGKLNAIPANRFS